MHQHSKKLAPTSTSDNNNKTTGSESVVEKKKPDADGFAETGILPKDLKILHSLFNQTVAANANEDFNVQDAFLTSSAFVD